MLDGLLKSKFYSKCKVGMKATKTRIEMVRRKRTSMVKYLKNDVVDLLKNGLDSNAYGRVEGLWNEINFSSCYDFVEQCCDLLLTNLAAMDKQRECPDECKEAASSIMFAAARFSDLPDLRELRTIFTDRFGRSIEIHANKEFVNKLTTTHPPRDVKIQLMQEIASESGLKWDSDNLRRQLNRPSEKADSDKNGQNLSPLSPVPPRPKADKTAEAVETGANDGSDGNTMANKPISVRRRARRSLEDQDTPENVKPVNHENSRIPNGRKHQNVKDDEEKALDKLLLHYSRKNLPPSTDVPPVKDRAREGIHLRRASLPNESSPTAAATRMCARATSFEPEVMNANHGHQPKIIEYDDFMARLAELRGTLK